MFKYRRIALMHSQQIADGSMEGIEGEYVEETVVLTMLHGEDARRFPYLVAALEDQRSNLDARRQFSELLHHWNSIGMYGAATPSRIRWVYVRIN